MCLRSDDFFKQSMFHVIDISREKYFQIYYICPEDGI